MTELDLIFAKIELEQMMEWSRWIEFVWSNSETFTTDENIEDMFVTYLHMIELEGKEVENG